MKRPGSIVRHFDPVTPQKKYVLSYKPKNAIGTLRIEFDFVVTDSSGVYKRFHDQNKVSVLEGKYANIHQILFGTISKIKTECTIDGVVTTHDYSCALLQARDQLSFSVTYRTVGNTGYARVLLKVNPLFGMAGLLRMSDFKMTLGFGRIRDILPESSVCEVGRTILAEFDQKYVSPMIRQIIPTLRFIEFLPDDTNVVIKFDVKNETSQITILSGLFVSSRPKDFSTVVKAGNNLVCITKSVTKLPHCGMLVDLAGCKLGHTVCVSLTLREIYNKPILLYVHGTS